MTLQLFDTDPYHEANRHTIADVFNHWVATCRPTGRAPVLDDKRRRKIKAAIISHGVDMCKQAIDGCAASEWHNGANPAGKTYNELTLILRDAEHIEKFVRYEQEAKELDEW